MDAVLLNEAERVLKNHPASAFDSPAGAAPDCIELVRQVEDNKAWQAAYESLDAFYVAHEAQHPDMRFYAAVRREIETDDPLTSPGGTISKRLASHRATAQ